MQVLKERDRTVFAHYRDGTITSIEIDVDSDLDTVVEAFKCFLLAITFSPGLVDRVIIDDDYKRGG